MVEEIQLMEFEDAIALDQLEAAPTQVPTVPGAQGNKKQKNKNGNHNNNTNNNGNQGRPIKKDERPTVTAPNPEYAGVNKSVTSEAPAQPVEAPNLIQVLAQAMDDLPAYLNMVDNYTKCVQSLLPVKPTTAAICVGAVTILAAFLAVKREE